MKPSWFKEHIKELIIAFLAVTGQFFFIMCAHRDLNPQPQIIMVESNILIGIAGFIIGRNLGKGEK